jgi:hypothetical protein
MIRVQAGSDFRADEAESPLATRNILSSLDLSL